MAIKKLLLIRKKDIRSTLLNEAELTQYLQGQPINVCPADRTAWPLEAGLSHYGFVLEFPKLKDYEAFQKWNEDPKTVEAAVIDFTDDVETTLLSVGHTIHPDA